MRTASAAILVLVMLAGCLSEPTTLPDGGPDAGPGDPPRQGESTADGDTGTNTSAPDEVTRLVLNGTILYRAPGTGPVVTEGSHDPGFCMSLPNNSLHLVGTFDYSPPQQAGLQFRHRSGNPAYASWYDDPTEIVLPQSSIRLEADKVPGGIWFVYGGPGSAGGGMTYTMVLEVTTDGPMPAADPPHLTPLPEDC